MEEQPAGGMASGCLRDPQTRKQTQERESLEPSARSQESLIRTSVSLGLRRSEYDNGNDLEWI